MGATYKPTWRDLNSPFNVSLHNKFTQYECTVTGQYWLKLLMESGKKRTFCLLFIRFPNATMTTALQSCSLAFKKYVHNDSQYVYNSWEAETNKSSPWPNRLYDCQNGCRWITLIYNVTCQVWLIMWFIWTLLCAPCEGFSTSFRNWKETVALLTLLCSVTVCVF